MTAVRSFVGLANFYIPNFSVIVKPLTDLTRKDIKFDWTEEADQAFKQLKKLLSSRPILHTFDSKLPIVVTTDASQVGIGCVITQSCGEQPVRTIAFWSAKLSEAESRYSNVERECLAVVRSFEQFRCWLDGATFTLRTDCSCLTWLFKLDHTNSRLHRWCIRLSAFDFIPTHIAGKTNVAADALSRFPVSFFARVNEAIDFEEVRRRQPEVAGLRLRKTTIIDGLHHVKLHGRDLPVVPPSLVPQLLKNIHESFNHCGVKKLVQLIAHRFWFPSRDPLIRSFVKSCHVCQMTKAPNQSMLRPTHPIETPERPMQIWACDFIVVGTAAAATSAKNILVVIDLHSRFVWAKAIKAQTKEALISFMSQLFEAVGAPKCLLSDNGTNLTSRAFEKFFDKWNVKHLFTPPFRSQANPTERVNGNINVALRATLLDHPTQKWSSLLKPVIDAINDVPHDSTGFTPRFLHFGQSDDGPDISIEQARQQATERSRSRQQQWKEKNDSLAKPQQFQIGDRVRYWLPESHPDRAKKFALRWWSPCVIIDRLGEDTFLVEQRDVSTGQMIRRFHCHSSRLLPYHSATDVNTNDELIDEHHSQSQSTHPTLNDSDASTMTNEVEVIAGRPTLATIPAGEV